MFALGIAKKTFFLAYFLITKEIKKVLLKNALGVLEFNSNYIYIYKSARIP